MGNALGRFAEGFAGVVVPQMIQDRRDKINAMREEKLQGEERAYRREEAAEQRAFVSGESEKQRTFSGGESEKQRTSTNEEAAEQRAFVSGESEKQRTFKSEEAERGDRRRAEIGVHKSKRGFKVVQTEDVAGRKSEDIYLVDLETGQVEYKNLEALRENAAKGQASGSGSGLTDAEREMVKNGAEPRPATDEEYGSLKPGELFRDPDDGRLKRKPGKAAEGNDQAGAAPAGVGGGGGRAYGPDGIMGKARDMVSIGSGGKVNPAVTPYLLPGMVTLRDPEKDVTERNTGGAQSILDSVRQRSQSAPHNYANDMAGRG